LNSGYAVAILGVLGVLVGGGMYAASWHRTIGIGGIVLGAILLIAGVWLSRSGKKAAVAPPQPG
jgi:protein-S-isoprenylcysteine O-methyltransferase Ste14